ncbi:MAG: HupE/UreJ family protein [Tsuneonella sp.]
MRWLLAAFVLLIASPSWADELRPGYVEFRQIDGANWSLGWKQPLSRPGPPRLVVPVVPGNCRIVDGPHQRVAALALVGNASMRCEGGLAGQRAGLPEIPGGGDVLMRVAPLDAGVQSYRLTPASPSVELSETPAVTQVWLTYGVLGIEHILEGWDHLMFVAALVLLVRRGWAVVKAVTAFTVAHSLTLAGVTMGLVGLPARPVEALIALSIVLLAGELLRPNDRPSLARRFPWLVAFAFGLIHGFGFAGALAEIGLPEGEVPVALLAFNLGVEAGQLAVVAVLVLALAALRKVAARAVDPAITVAAYAIGITATYWLIERLVF